MLHMKAQTFEKFEKFLVKVDKVMRWVLRAAPFACFGVAVATGDALLYFMAIVLFVWNEVIDMREEIQKLMEFFGVQNAIAELIHTSIARAAEDNSNNAFRTSNVPPRELN